MLLGIPCLVENPWTSIGVIHKDSGHLLSPKKIYANKCKRPWDPHLAPVDGEICFANHPRNGWFMSFGLFGGRCRQRLPLMFQCKLWGTCTNPFEIPCFFKFDQLGSDWLPLLLPVQEVSQHKRSELGNQMTDLRTRTTRHRILGHNLGHGWPWNHDFLMRNHPFVIPCHELSSLVACRKKLSCTW